MNRFKLLLATLLLATVIPSALSQVSVYRLSFEQDENSLNLDFYDDGFLICPGLGGTCSLVLVEDQGGLKVFERSDGVGRHFVALGAGSQERKAVFSTFVENGTAEAYYLVSGDLDTSISGSTELFEFRSFVASKMAGYVLASDDEADATELAADGSLGYAGLASMTAEFLDNRTEFSNDRGLNVTETADEIVNLLRANGYIRDGETAPGTLVGAINGVTGTDIDSVTDQLNAAQTSQVQEQTTSAAGAQ